MEENNFRGGITMFTKTQLLILKHEEDVDRVTRLAANFNVQTMYKIGVYGQERQHEIYLIGKPWNIRKFAKKHIVSPYEN
jgi:hypothetical protein